METTAGKPETRGKFQPDWLPAWAGFVPRLIGQESKREGLEVGSSTCRPKGASIQHPVGDPGDYYCKREDIARVSTIRSRRFGDFPELCFCAGCNARESATTLVKTIGHHHNCLAQGCLHSSSAHQPDGKVEGLESLVELLVERVHLGQLGVQGISRVVGHSLEQPACGCTERISCAC